MSHPSHGLAVHHASRNRATRAIDGLAYMVGIGGNAAVIPQVIKAWQNDAPGLAVTTWVLFTLVGVIWLMYAIVHQSKPLIVAQVAGISANLLVVSGWAFNHWLR